MLPTLRARNGDCLLLADHFAGPGWEFEPGFRETIAHYPWPGNVRQLINAIERTKMLAEDEVLRSENLPPEVLGRAASPGDGVFSADSDLATLTRARVVQALQRENGNKLRSAKFLGVSRRSLYRLIEKYNSQQGEIDGAS